MRNRAYLLVALLGILTFALAPGVAAAGQGKNLSEIALAADAAARAAAVSGPVISVSPLGHDYGIVNVGSSGTFIFTISNTGDAALTISGAASSSPSFGATVGSSLIPVGGSTSMTVDYAPTAGVNETAIITVSSNATNGPFMVNVSGSGNMPPVLAPIGDKGVAAFQLLTFQATASDNNDQIDDQVSFTLNPQPLPPGATFDTSTGVFAWTPGLSDAGPHTFTFCATDGHAQDCETITITVTADNSPPVANPGGPYAGIPNVDIQLDGSKSTDPDAGQTLSYAWNFGDGNSATGPTPLHDWMLAGTYIVTLTVTDNGSPNLSNTAITSAVIKNAISVDLLAKLSGNELPLDGTANKGLRMSIQLQDPSQTSLLNINQASIEIRSSSTAGAIPLAKPDPKSFKIGDLNGDGTDDLEFQVNYLDLKQLIGGVPNNTLVTLTVDGLTLSGTQLPIHGTGGPYTVKNTGISHPPIVDAPATLQNGPGQLLNLVITCIDPDGDQMISFGAAPLPSGATFTSNATHLSGTLTWTPTEAQTGFHTITFTAVSQTFNGTNESGSDTTRIEVVNRKPVVTAPAAVSAPPLVQLQLVVTAADPDQEAISSFTANLSGLPAGNNAAFATNALKSSGTLTWTPTLAMISPKQGQNIIPYPVVLSASNSLQSNPVTTNISVIDRPAIITAPATVNATADVLLSVNVFANDPDGHPITSLTLNASDLPAGNDATLVPNATNTIGLFTWTPKTADVRNPPYTATFLAASNSVTGTALMDITVGGNSGPVVGAPAGLSAAHAKELTIDVTATDADGDAISSLTMNASGLPAGNNATFVPNAINSAGTFKWTPALSAVRLAPWTVSFTATSGTPARTGSRTTAITVTDARPAVAVAELANFPTNKTSILKVFAADSDGDPVTNITADLSDLPAGHNAAFVFDSTNVDGGFGHLAWAPTPTMITHGNPYDVTFTAFSTNLTGTGTGHIDVSANLPPVVTAPASVAANATTLVKFDVFFSDPDGDAILTASMNKSALPAGNDADFVPDLGAGKGEFTWTPTAADIRALPWNVSFSATAGSPILTGSATTAIIVGNNDGPVVTAPAAATTPKNIQVTVLVSVSDADGDDITSLRANTQGIGSFQVDGCIIDPTDLTKVTLPVNLNVAVGTIVTGDFIAPGTWIASFTDASHIVLSQPATQAGGSETLFFSKAQFTTNATKTSGTFKWTPLGTDVGGGFFVEFLATSGSPAAIASKTTAITVTDRKSVITRPATFTAGVVLPALATVRKFQVSAADPDFDVVTLSASFSAGTGLNLAAAHFAFANDSTNALAAYGTVSCKPDPTATPSVLGSYTATFTATSLGGTTTAATTVNVVDRLPVVTAPVATSFVQSTQGQINVLASDPDGNGLTSLTAITSGLPAGNTATFTANATNSAGTFLWTPLLGDVRQNPYAVTFRAVDGTAKIGTASTAITVTKSIQGAPTIASSPAVRFGAKISPNPFNPQTKLKFATTREGYVKVKLYDLQGRLVRTLVDEASMAAGTHEVSFDGRSNSGTKLGSGQYFYSLQAAEGTLKGRFTILK